MPARSCSPSGSRPGARSSVMAGVRFFHSMGRGGRGLLRAGTLSWQSRPSQGLGLPVVEAYEHLRTAEELARAGRRKEAEGLLAPALAFYRKVGAARYVTQDELGKF